MLALSMLAALVALAIAGASIARVLEGFVTQGLDQRLDAELSLLAGAVRADGSIDRERLTRSRGLLDAGPEWRWRIAGPSGAIGSADMPALRPTPPPPLPGPPDDGRPRPVEVEGIHARTIVIQTARGPVTLSAAAPRAVVSRPIRSALLPLLATLAVLSGVLALATLVQLRLGLRPLRRLREDVAAIRAGRASRVAEDQPAELRPLAVELNALAHDNDAALAAARASAANLAHALKTPVATLSLGLADDPVHAAQVARIDATIRHHLSRARGDGAARRAATPLAPAIDALAGTVARLHADRPVAIYRSLPADLAIAIDAADLDEIAGNLIDNAVRHARTRVAIDAVRDGRMAIVTVTDDGPGISEADRARAVTAGVRLDERGDGHGFGLSIVRELAELHGGALTLGEAPGGGLSARVSLAAA
jgi:signal transduction histidine kinase